MRIRLYVVIDQESDALEQEVKQALCDICPKLSFSPAREQPTLRNCLEWFGTADLSQEEIEKLLSILNNDWDGDMMDCSAYGFNTTMFHEHVYYLQFQIQ